LESGCYFYIKIHCMKKNLFLVTFIFCYGLFTACNTATPQDYFDIAILNSNMMHGFANRIQQSELESPSVKMVDGSKDKFEPMKRKEVIESKIQFIEESLEKVKRLEETEDTKDILQASLALYNYVLPVYKNEYQQLAKLYDDGAPKEQIDLMEHSIEEKYYPKFEELYNGLAAAGKPYAERHNIKVNWDVQTSPR